MKDTARQELTILMSMGLSFISIRDFIEKILKINENFLRKGLKRK